MPKYDYRCPRCGHTEEVQHGIMDRVFPRCPVCTDETIGPITYMRKLFTPVAVSFKGSGFYRTDNPKLKHVKSRMEVNGK